MYIQTEFYDTTYMVMQTIDADNLYGICWNQIFVCEKLEFYSTMEIS